MQSQRKIISGVVNKMKTNVGYSCMIYSGEVCGNQNVESAKLVTHKRAAVHKAKPKGVREDRKTDNVNIF